MFIEEFDIYTVGISACVDHERCWDAVDGPLVLEQGVVHGRVLDAGELDSRLGWVAVPTPQASRDLAH